MFRLFNKDASECRMLGKEDILNTYLLYMKQIGNSRGVLRDRLDALLRAYNSKCGKNPSQEFPFEAAGAYIVLDRSFAPLRMTREF